MSEQVVKRWRQRELSLGRQAWRCSQCQQISMVKRARCTGCGGADLEAAPLPRRGVVVAACMAGAAVEHLDQVTDRKAALWVELDGGGTVACLLAHADSHRLFDHIRQKPVRLAVRRMTLGQTHGAEPIEYGLKATIDLETRASIVESLAAAGAASTNKES